MSLKVQKLVINYILDTNSNKQIEALDEAINYASKNKVLLHFLRKTNIENPVRKREEARYKVFIKNLHEVAKALKNTNHAFIKLRKPVAYVPSDIDVLVDRRCILKAIIELKKLGFKVEVEEPYCVTMTRGNTIVDLYIQPTIAGVIYIEANELLKHKEYTEYNGITIPILKTYAEALLTIAHAVYKERIYTLNDYITVKKWLSRKTIELAEKLKCIDAVKEALAIHKLFEESKVTLPYKIPLAKWIKMLQSKMTCDELARATLPNIIKSIKDYRLGRLIASKLLRASY